MQRSVSRVSLVAVVMLVGLTVAAGAQAPDPIIGTWKLNLVKSKYSPGPPPKSTTVKITPAGKGYSVDVDAASTVGTGAGGTTTYRKAGKPVSTLTSSVSQDGKVLTVTTKATDAQGRAVNNVAVYARQ